MFLPLFVLVFPQHRSDEPFGKELVWYVFFTAERVAWENSRHFATPPLVSPRNNVWETSTEIPYWWRVTTLVWVVLLIGWRKLPSPHDQSEVLTRSGKWNVLAPQTSFRGETICGVQNFGCFLRLLKDPVVVFCAYAGLWVLIRKNSFQFDFGNKKNTFSTGIDFLRTVYAMLNLLKKSHVICKGSAQDIFLFFLMHQSIPPGFCTARAGAGHLPTPGPFPSFWHARGFLSEYNYTEGFTGKAVWLICQGQK